MENNLDCDKAYTVNLIKSMIKNLPRKERVPYQNILVRNSLANRFNDMRFLEPKLNKELSKI